MPEPGYSRVAEPAVERKARGKGVSNALCLGVAGALGVLALVLGWLHVRAPAVTGPFESEAHRDTRLKGDSAKWVPFEAHEHPSTPSAIWGRLQRPYPTGAWYTNLVVGGPNNELGDGEGGAMLTPYGLTVTPKAGVGLSLGAMNVANTSLTLSVSNEFAVSAKEGVARRYIIDADDLTMTMRVEAEGGEVAYFDALLARGCPYVTLRFAGATPAISSEQRIHVLLDGELPPQKSLVHADVPANSDMSKFAKQRDCKLRPTCDDANLKGFCCPQPSGVFHPCCGDPLAIVGPSSTFTAVLGNGQHWRIYTSSPITLKWSSTSIEAFEEFTGVMRVAAIPDAVAVAARPPLPANATERPWTDIDWLDAHAETYPVNGAVRWSMAAENVGILEYEWKVGYMDREGGRRRAAEEEKPALVMLALPHHLENMVAADEDADGYVVGFVDAALTYRGGLLGLVKPVLGARWRLAYPLTTIKWTGDPAELNAEETEALRAQIKVDVARPNGEPDAKAAWIAHDEYKGNAYWNGKEMAKLATLALVGEAVDDHPSTESAVRQFRAILDEWLQRTNSDPLIYDVTYGGVCTVDGLYDHNADFGNGYYNDHHFHYGYILYAAAVAIKFDAGFASQYRAELLALLYDITALGLDDDGKKNKAAAAANNDNINNKLRGNGAQEVTGLALTVEGLDQAAFPRARHKDFYEGHSWASGIFFMGQGKAQESSSEAVNAYYAAYLVAFALGDAALADWNRLLLAMEIQTAKAYVHMDPDAKHRNYPRPFTKARMVGVLGALSTQAQTWFGPSPAYAHGIQILPVSPITAELFDDLDFVAGDVEYMDHLTLGDDIEDSWRAFHECERAKIDPMTAWKNLNDLASVDDGTTKTALLYWVATQPTKDVERTGAES